MIGTFQLERTVGAPKDITPNRTAPKAATFLGQPLSAARMARTAQLGWSVPATSSRSWP